MRSLSFFLLAVWLTGTACAFSWRLSTPAPELPTAPATGAQTSAPPPPPSPRPTSATPPPVPAEYQPLYHELKGELSHFEGTLNESWDHRHGQTVFATELAFANGNVGEGLLAPRMMDLNRTLLDRLEAMGVKGVVLAIKYPLLRPDFPRASEYLQFFEDIVAECHRHDMKVLVEAGAIFAGTPYSPVQVDWSKYTTGTFLQGLGDQLVLISREVRPDYLTLANEPTTEEALTRLKITPAVWSDFIRMTLGRVDRSHGMLAGAGSGTWESPAYIDSILHMGGLDYIDLHIYPLGKDAAMLERVLAVAAEARAAGKRVTISECWLYKASPAELGTGLGNVEVIQNRDVYSFWSPLEARYLQDIIALAEATRMDFASFFWTRNFFAYLDYDSSPRDLSTAEFNREINQTALPNVQNGTLSPLGLALEEQLQARTTP